MTMRRLAYLAALPIALVCTCLVSVHAAQDLASQRKDGVATPAAPTKTAFAYEDFRIVPVRVHLLRDSETQSAITRLTEKDVARIFSKANGIWHAAGVHLWVESIVAEKPASTAGYERSATLPAEALLALRPEDTRKSLMFHVYYIGEMSPNGIFMRRDGIFVKESARLRPVAGGIDEPLPRLVLLLLFLQFLPDFVEVTQDLGAKIVRTKVG